MHRFLLWLFLASFDFTSYNFRSVVVRRRHTHVGFIAIRYRSTIFVRMHLVVFIHSLIEAALLLVVEVERLEQRRRLVKLLGQLIPLRADFLQLLSQLLNFVVGERSGAEQMSAHLALDACETRRTAFGDVRGNLEFLDDRITFLGCKLKET